MALLVPLDRRPFCQLSNRLYQSLEWIYLLFFIPTPQYVCNYLPLKTSKYCGKPPFGACPLTQLRNFPRAAAERTLQVISKEGFDSEQSQKSVVSAR